MNPESKPEIPLAENDDSQIKEDKLFTFKDIEGNNQYEAVELAGKLLDFLKEKDLRIKAISICGSTVKGYADRDSDLDIYLIYEDDYAGGSVFADVESKYIPEFEEEYSVKIHLLDHINMTLINDSIIIKYPHFVRELVFPIIGDVDLVKSYIIKVRDIVSRLNHSEQDEWVRNFIKFLKLAETPKKESKRRESYGLEYKKTSSIIEDRLKVYEQRIKKLFID